MYIAKIVNIVLYYIIIVKISKIEILTFFNTNFFIFMMVLRSQIRNRPTKLKLEIFHD